VVAQVDEQEAAVIALAVDPAGQTDLLADVIEVEGGARVRSMSGHEGLPPEKRVGGDRLA
jgi:hypothetical protein